MAKKKIFFVVCVLETTCLFLWKRCPTLNVLPECPTLLDIIH